MSNDNANKNNNRKKRNTDIEFKVDPTVLKMLSDNYVHVIQKASTKFPKAKFICKICPYHIADTDKAIKHCNEATHKKNVKRISCRNMMQYIHEPTNVQLDVINDSIIDILNMDIFISEDESNRRKGIYDNMNILSGGHLTLCGSIVTGMSIANVSDVNLYLEMKGQSVSYLSELERLSAAFEEKLSLTTEIKLDKNNCGLFCKDSAGVSYHISASTRMCKLTSDLMAVYLQIDSRAEKLMKLFRYFASQAFLDRYLDGLFPSSVFHLMTVFYLQQLSPPLLPNLHHLADQNANLSSDLITTVIVNDNRIQYVSDIDTILRIWTPPKNILTMAQLWVGLLRFYAVDFDSNTYMVNIRSTDPVLKIDRNIIHKRLAVDDPFDLKRNLLFSYNNADAVDFFNDQLQGCYIYFAIPQLSTGPAFSKVNFTEMSLQSMLTNCLVTPTFSKDNFTMSIELMEVEFRRLYKSESATHDVSKWPLRLFVKLCLQSILTSIFDTRLEIDSFVSLLEVKGSSYLSIGNNCDNFLGHAMSLAMCVFKDFSDYFEATGTWNKSEINTHQAFDIIKRAAQKFITATPSITVNDDDNDDDEYEMHDMEGDEAEIEQILEDLAITIEDCPEEPDTVKSPDNNNDEDTNTAKCLELESWKIPISFKLIYLPIKGMLESSSEPDVYNEHRVQSLLREELECSFTKILIHKQKLEIICSFCNGKGHRKEYCRDAIPRFEEMKYILRDLNPSWLDKLNSILVHKYEGTLPTPGRVDLHEKIFNEINKIIKNLYTNARPQMFGSSHNGFMTRASDIDICLEFVNDDKRQLLSSKDITTRLKNIGQDLKKFIPGIDVSYVLRAKVPIIKFYLPDHIQGDISINNTLAILNTRMLKFYAEIYPNMKGLGNLLKFMSKSCDIGDASQGTLSSYAYIIMLIHFLQKRGLLPVLQELYEGDNRPSYIIDGWDAWYQSSSDTIYKLWKPRPNTVSFEYLWLDFFYYYAVEFDIDKEVVSIKQSKPLYKIDKGWQMSYLAIEDPFDLNHNLSGSLSLDKCRYILHCFAHVLKLHGNNIHLSSKENTHYLLMEPSALRPACTPNNSRTCFKCNKTGHVARDCTENQYQRNPVRDFPNLASPLQLKESVITNRFFVQSDLSESASNLSIPLKTFNGSINEFSVIPISLNVDDKTIVIPMLVDKNGRVADTLNSAFKNGYHNMCSLSFGANANIFKIPEISQNYNVNPIFSNNINSIHGIPTNTIPMNHIPMNNNPINLAHGNPTFSNNNMRKSNTKKLPTPVQNNRVQNDHYNPQIMNKTGPTANQNVNQNQTRFMNYNPTINIANMNRNSGFNSPQGFQYGPGMPRQFMPQQNVDNYPLTNLEFYPTPTQDFYQHGGQQNNRQMTPNNTRYPQNKGNK